MITRTFSMLLLMASPAFSQDANVECNRAIQRGELHRVPGIALEIVSKGLASEKSQRCMIFARISAEATVVPKTIKACDELFIKDESSAILNPVCNEAYRLYGLPDSR